MSCLQSNTSKNSLAAAVESTEPLATDSKERVQSFKRLDEICLKADLIAATRDLDFPEFSGDGAYLTHYTVDQLVKTLGKQDDAGEIPSAELLEDRVGQALALRLEDLLVLRAARAEAEAQALAEGDDRLPEAEAIINRMGFNNQGVDRLVANVHESNWRGVLGINIGKNFDTPHEHAVRDYVACLRKVYGLASYVTINISSPNTKGLRDLQGSDQLEALLGALAAERAALANRYGRQVPLALKIAPDLDAAQVSAVADLLERLLHRAQVGHAVMRVIDQDFPGPGLQSGFHNLLDLTGQLGHGPVIGRTIRRGRTLEGGRDAARPLQIRGNIESGHRTASCSPAIRKRRRRPSCRCSG